MADWVVRLDEGGWSPQGTVAEQLAARWAARMIARAGSIHVSLGDVAATLVLVGVAVAVSFWRRADLEEDIGIAVVRSFDPADRDRLRDQLHLRPGQPLVRGRADRGDGRVRRPSRPGSGPSRCPTPSGRCCWRWRSPAAATLGLVVALGRLQAAAALPGPGRRDGGRQLDDRGRRGAQPARRRDDPTTPARSRRRWRSAPPPPWRRRRSSAAACARG